jgi:flagellar hook-associated protein 1 FlgK
MKNKNDPLYMAKDEPLKIRITGNTGGVITYDILDKNGDPIILPTGSQIPSAVPPAVPIAVGDPMTNLTAKPDPLTGKVTFSFAGVDIEMAKGSPNAADEFTVSFEQTGPGDNRNMLIMSSLQSEKIMNGNKATFQDVYSGMVSVIGSKTANADISMQSAAVLKTQAFDRVQTVSGVNMDEEAANLLRFQQYYSASARVISIASELFDTILQAGR